MPVPTLSYASPADSAPRTLLIRFVEWLTGRPSLERRYAAARRRDQGSTWAAALEELQVSLTVAPPGYRERIPGDRSLIVVSNHPFGVLDGIAICRLLSSTRPDFRVLVNRVLCQDQEGADHFLPVDFSSSSSAQRENIRSIRRALEHVDAGGALVLFPAGGVATSPTLFGSAEDLPWKPLLGTLVQRTEASVLPVYFEGQNSRLFQVASHVNQTLRLSLLLRELLRKEGHTLEATVGRPVSSEDLDSFESRRAIVDRLREKTMSLASTQAFQTRTECASL